jgi:hypothetical protein
VKPVGDEVALEFLCQMRRRVIKAHVLEGHGTFINPCRIYSKIYASYT